MSKVIIIDFDNTIAMSKNVFPETGEPYEGVKESLQKLKDSGFKIKIHSCRTSKDYCWKPRERVMHLHKMSEFMNEHQIPYDEIIDDMDKPIAEFYIDDRAIGFRGNWKKIIEEIEEMGCLIIKKQK